jgi:hypothetical protein
MYVEVLRRADPPLKEFYRLCIETTKLPRPDRRVVHQVIIIKIKPLFLIKHHALEMDGE